MQAKPCAFCTLPIERVIDSNNYGVVIRDGFPISPGHTLIIPKRHISSFFELETDERQDLLNLLEAAKKILHEEFKPNGAPHGVVPGLHSSITRSNNTHPKKRTHLVIGSEYALAVCHQDTSHTVAITR